jgi:hypothetical protein
MHLDHSAFADPVLNTSLPNLHVLMFWGKTGPIRLGMVSALCLSDLLAAADVSFTWTRMAGYLRVQIRGKSNTDTTVIVRRVGMATRADP